MATDKLIINSTNAAQAMKYRSMEKQLIFTGEFWHKFVIHNVSTLDKEIVLKTILDAVHPYDLIPVKYQIEDKDAFFMARNCGGAIEKLCRNSLIITNSDGQSFNLTIIVGFSTTSETQLNVQTNIEGTIKKRFNSDDSSLNLDSFHRDTELSELIFCILSQPKILYFVLHVSRTLFPTSLTLSNNELRNLGPMEIFGSTKTLTSLDLRNNLIEDIVDLAPIKNLYISELWLDGNPLCNNYEEIAYIQAVKEICPHLKKLDGMSVFSKGFLAFRRNFVISSDSTMFVDQFLAHYFLLYDSADRKCLGGLYHKNAVFSLSCSYLPGQSNSNTTKLENYKWSSRNLLTLSDLSKSSEQLIIGSENVLAKLCSLPQTEHDQYTFTIDVVQYTSVTVVLIITGTFREPTENPSDPEQLYGFSRTFVLIGKDTGEFVIGNEMLHVTNATSGLASRPFKSEPVVKCNAISLPSFCAKDDQERTEMIEALCKITTLNSNYSRKCLVDSEWNFKKAIQIFVDLYKLEKLPGEAFII